MTAANSLNISEVGFQSFDGVNLFKVRTLTAGTGITITNGTGVSGNPVISTIGGAPVTSVATANATPQFVLAGSTETVDFAITNLVLGSALPALTSGTRNTGLGSGVFASITSGQRNVAIGSLCFGVATTATDNVIIGDRAGLTLTTSSNNTIVGSGAGAAITSGVSNSAFGTNALAQYTAGAGNAGANIALGINSLVNLTTGIQNIGIGSSSGSAYTTSESYNIAIYSPGVVGESNTIRIGTQGAAQGQQNRAFIAGITGTTVVGPAMNVDSSGQIGALEALTNGQLYIGSTGASPVAATVTGSAIAVSGGAGTLNLAVTGGGLTWNNVTGATQTVFSRNGYIANRATLVTFTMNGTNIGDVARIVGKGAGGWTLLPTGSQRFYFGNTASTLTTGSLSSTDPGDCVELVALSSTEIIVMSSIGNITVV